MKNTNNILLGFGGHHMEKRYPRSNIEYENLLTNLVPLLKSLATKALIIWTHQNPIIDTSSTRDIQWLIVDRKCSSTPSATGCSLETYGHQTSNKKLL
jgi:hypothetical protein